MASKHEVARAGISFGTALAITISWSLHHSLLWAGIHGILGWFYVVYLFACFRMWSLMRWPCLWSLRRP